MTSSILTRRSPFADPHLRDIAARIAALDWHSLAAALDTHGCATTGPLLTPEECAALRELYAAEAPFRSRIVMARHGFGRGEYKYFSYPLPALIESLRATCTHSLCPSRIAGTP
jgi:uncharacterized protein